MFPPELACDFDFDRDGDIDGPDLAEFALSYSNNDLKLDLNRNGSIDDDDITAMSDNFSRGDCERSP